MTIFSNPYRETASISDPRRFFNRVDTIERILNALLSGSAQCLSIVGQRKIGKTSLVQHLMRPSTMLNFGFTDRDAVFVYINCQMYPSALNSIESFHQLLVQCLQKEISPQRSNVIVQQTLAESGPDRWQVEWRRMLETLVEQGIYVLLIFDEFDKAIMRENLIKDGLFGSLRAYGHYAKFAWVTCTHQSLHIVFDSAFDAFKISKSIRKTESDFFNIVPGDHIVGLFEAEDIHELINVPSQSNGITFSEEDLQFIQDFGGRFPYFVQRACFHIFDARQHGPLKYQGILQRCLKEATQIWTSYWNELHSRQQEILLSIAGKQTLQATLTELEDLQDRALIYEDGGKWHVFSKEFGRFVLSRESPHRETDVEVGEMLWEQYQVVKIAGRTKHSQVIKAWDTALNRYVAIKYIYSDQRLSAELLAQSQNRLLREGLIMLDIAKDLNHKNIGKVFAARAQPSAIFMQWIDGWSLQDRLQEGTEIAIVDVLKIGMGLAAALEHIHARGVVHRDIKPNNVIVNKDEDAILIDFDIARSIDRDTIAQRDDGTFIYVGNPHYSAPEQLLSPERVGPPADIFALGVLLYELITHEWPFLYDNFPRNSEGSLPVPPPEKIPQPLYKLLCTLLDQEPTRRPDAHQLLEQLRNHLASYEKEQSL